MVKHMDDLPLENMLVRFRIRDIYIPSPHEILDTLNGDDILEGRVVSITRHVDGRIFAIAEVKDLETPIIIPIDRIIFNGPE